MNINEQSSGVFVLLKILLKKPLFIDSICRISSSFGTPVFPSDFHIPSVHRTKPRLCEYGEKLAFVSYSAPCVTVEQHPYGE